MSYSAKEVSGPLKRRRETLLIWPPYALLKTMTHLPIIVDPSHATGIAGLVKPMAMAATAAGADGIMIEVHNKPYSSSLRRSSVPHPKSFCRCNGCNKQNKAYRIQRIV